MENKMRDKLTDIIGTHTDCTMSQDSCLADAIIDALPSMVVPLVWEYPRDFPYMVANTKLGIYSISSDEDSPSRMMLNFALTDESSFTRWSIELENGVFEPEELQQKAQAHHVTVSCAAFGVVA